MEPICKPSKRSVLQAKFRFGLLVSLASSQLLGCQTPAWWAYRSMDCIPPAADNVATEYLQTCGENSGNSSTSSDAPASSDPLKLPRELPGTQTPDLIAPLRDNLEPQTYREELKRLYPELAPIESNQVAMPDSISESSPLEGLHQLARENHPGLKAAVASVEAARGLMIQAGLPPNPSIGYQADTVRTLNTPGYHGAYLQQTIITARKLGLSAEAAAVDYANALVEQRKTWVQVMTQIRRAYFDVLAARRQHPARRLHGAWQAGDDHPVEAHARRAEGMAGAIGLLLPGRIQRHALREEGFAGVVEIRDAAMPHQVDAAAQAAWIVHGAPCRFFRPSYTRCHSGMAKRRHFACWQLIP